MSLGEAVVDVGANTSGFESDLNKGVTKAGAKAGAGFNSSFKRSLKTTAATLGLASVGVATVGLIKNSVQLEASYSKTMRLVAASTGAPASAIGDLDKLAMQLGADTQFSANDAAGAMLELGKAGISTADIMGGALAGDLLLASAGGTDLATSSTIAANAMNTFNLSGKDMNSVAAALAGGANASSASVESLGQALQQVGPGATNAGLSLQQTVGVLSAFDAAGIKGSDAGTSLKTMLSRLVPQTDKARAAQEKYNLSFVKADGSFRSITEIAQQLQDGLGGLTEEQKTQALTTLFGSDATRAATVLLNQGEKGVRKFIKATKDQNAAQELAKANMSGTSGALERLRGSVETAELALGKALAPTIEKTADFLSDKAVPAITDFITGMQDGTGAGGDFADILKDFLSVGQGILKFFNAIPGPIKKYGAEILIAAFAMNKLNSGLLAGKASVTSWVGGLSTAEGAHRRVTKSAYDLGVGLRNVAGAGGMLAVVDGANRSNKALGVLETTLGAAAAGFAVGGPVGAGLGAGIGLFVSFKNAIAGTNDVKMPTVKALGLSDIITGLDTATTKATEFTRSSLFDFLRGKTKGTTPLGSSQGQSIRDTAKLYGIPDKQLVDAMTGNVKQFEAIKTRLRKAMQNDPNGFAAVDFDTIVGSIRTMNKEYRKQQQEIREAISANGDYKKLLAGFPPELITKISTVGLPVTEAGVVRLTRKMHLTPKQIKTVIAATNVPTTLAKVQSIINKGNEWSRLHPTTTVDANTQPARDKVSALVSSIRSLLAGNFTAFVNASVTGAPKERAHGGRIAAHTPYIVGEQRPELFVSNTAGRILPKVPPLPLANTRSSTTGTGSSTVDRSASLTIINPVAENIEQSAPRALSNLSFILGG